MPATDHYETLVIGSGESGKHIAWTMAKAGHRTAVIERKLIGGSCPNIACLPSKNIIHSAKVASFIRRGAEFGLELGAPAVNLAGVQLRKTKNGGGSGEYSPRPIQGQRRGTHHG